jgi:hypothetical protein
MSVVGGKAETPAPGEYFAFCPRADIKGYFGRTYQRGKWRHAPNSEISE